MMRISVAVSLALAAVAGGARGQSCGRPGHGYVVMVSLDGFRADYLRPDDTPNLLQMAREGARSVGMQPVFPSKTFPNHYSIVTGLYVAHHGIAGNHFWDPDRRQWYDIHDSTAADGGWYGGEPLWVTAEREGVRSAAFLWPGSEASIGGFRPSRYKIFKTDSKIAPADRMDSLAAWLALPACQRPHLVLGYVETVDQAGHAAGPDGARTRDAVRATDAVVGRLLTAVRASAVRDSVTVIIVADHGMAAVDHWDNLLDPLGADSVRPVAIAQEGPVAAAWFGGDSARLRRATAVLTAAVQHGHVYTRQTLPARFHASIPRIGDLVVVADEGWSYGPVSPTHLVTTGGHGYDPMLPSMQALFVAQGRGIRPGVVLPAFENVDVYPLIARLLELTPAAVDGVIDPLTPALAPR
jgi:predicted AlkP superfamily pyrophosphatase or phosphodiesterase